MKVELRNGKIYIPSSTSPRMLQKNKSQYQNSHVNIKPDSREVTHSSQRNLHQNQKMDLVPTCVFRHSQDYTVLIGLIVPVYS